MAEFKKLAVWARAHALVLELFKTALSFPPEQRFTLTRQAQRAALSIPANIAEGCGRFGKADRVHFLRVACGSANELEYYLLAARDLGFLKDSTHRALSSELIEVRKMLFGLIAAWQTKHPTA
jgi:four helix bundle protein